MSDGVLKKIHISGQYIKDDKDLYDKDPDRPIRAVITVWREGERNVAGSRVRLSGASEIVYEPRNPIPYGGGLVSLWVETRDEVFVLVEGDWVLIT